MSCESDATGPAQHSGDAYEHAHARNPVSVAVVPVVWRTPGSDHSAAIRAAHDDFRLTVLERTVALGEALAAAKADLRHGSFLQWVQSACDVPPRRAQEAMQVARRWNALPVEMRGDPRISTVAAVLQGKQPARPKPRPPLIEGEATEVVEEEVQLRRDAKALEEISKRIRPTDQRLARRIGGAARVLVERARELRSQK